VCITSWKDRGGAGEVRALQGALIVKQTALVHHSIQRFLAQIEPKSSPDHELREPLPIQPRRPDSPDPFGVLSPAGRSGRKTRNAPATDRPKSPIKSESRTVAIVDGAIFAMTWEAPAAAYEHRWLYLNHAQRLLNFNLQFAFFNLQFSILPSRALKTKMTDSNLNLLSPGAVRATAARLGRIRVAPGGADETECLHSSTSKTSGPASSAHAAVPCDHCFAVFVTPSAIIVMIG